MKKLLNVLYVTIAESYLSLDGENILVRKEDEVVLRLPLHNLENVVCFNYLGASPALMAACSERNIGLTFLSPNGRFQARIQGRVKGNVLLRKAQYRICEDKATSLKIARTFLIGKVYNCRKVLERAIRDHGMVIDGQKIREMSNVLKSSLPYIAECENLNDLFGLEGSAARSYFNAFDHLILHQKEDFFFHERSRRPPLDNLNALLSFLYSLLTNEAVSALEAVGLDPYVGFLHQDRPGRPSLALDLMEELRPVFADRVALSLVNLRQINRKGFVIKESGGVLMDDETRKNVLQVWQERKKESIMHPFLKEKIDFGLIIYAQAMLLARFLRGDLDNYPPFFWS